MISSGPTPRNRIGHEDKLSLKHTQRYFTLHLTFRFPIEHSIDNYPQVTKLCGPEPLTKYIILFVVSLQTLCAYLLRDTPFLSWKFFLTAYIIGATANQNLFLAIHEISHNLAFRSPDANRLIAIFANLPIGV